MRTNTWLFILITCVILAFGSGAELARRNTIRAFGNRSHLADIQNELGHYLIYRTLAKDLSEGHIQDASCSAALEASASLDEIRKCVSTEPCRDALSGDLKKTAPEVFGLVPLQFDYIPAKSGIRACK